MSLVLIVENNYSVLNTTMTNLGTIDDLESRAHGLAGDKQRDLADQALDLLCTGILGTKLAQLCPEARVL